MHVSLPARGRLCFGDRIPQVLNLRVTAKAAPAMFPAGSTSEESGLSVRQQELVRDSLQSILDSQHFSKSKRYPALIEYVVVNTLEGNSGALKERIVGAEVFGRSPGYDPGTDPVVRIAAGEVRRRLAEYYSEHPDAPVRIELPRGGYIAEFHFRSEPESRAAFQEPAAHSSVGTDSEARELGTIAGFPVQPSVGTASARPWWSHKATIAIAAAMLVVVAAAIGAAWRYQLERGKRDFWWPVLHTTQPTMIVVGRHQDAAQAAATQTATTDPESPGRMNLLLDDVIVTAQTCNVFRAYGHDCTILPAQTVTENDFRGKSIVVLGAFNNQWMPRVSASLPYQVRSGDYAPEGRGGRMIVEHKLTGDTPIWVLDSAMDSRGVKAGTDYAIIARFHSDITKGLAVWIAGLGPEGTRGAGKFLASQDQMAQLLARAPQGWKGSELEAVLEVDFAQGQPTSEKVLAARFW